MKAWIAICLAACGSVTDRHNVDARAGDDAPQQLDARIDATPDAPANVTFTSVLQFPTPNTVVGDFDDATLAAAGITGSSFNICGGSETGNVDAPISNNCASMLSNTQTPTFVFATPIHAVGMSFDDIDYGNDNPVVV